MIRGILLTLVMCFAFLMVSRGQAYIYHPFPVDSAVWMQDHGNTGTMTYSYTRYYLLGDTIISGTSYGKMYTSGGAGSSSAIPTPVTPYSFTGGLREDIPAKKIYYYDAASGTEELLYDFSLNVGDVVMIDSLYFPPGHDTIKVFAIDSVIVDGAYRKRLVLGSTENPPSTMVYGNIIEGVGNEAGLREFVRDGFENNFDLLCLSVNNVNVYPLSGGTPHPYRCAYPVGLSEIDKELAVTVFPNPASPEARLIVGCNDKLDVEILDVSGTLLNRRDNLAPDDIRIDLSGYAPGVYLLRLTDQKGHSISKRIVKQ